MAAVIKAAEITGLEDTIRYLEALRKDQVPYATARALTSVANEARKSVVDRLGNKYKLRGVWWKAGQRFGVNVVTAKKKDTPIVSSVFSRADWLSLHETGGIKKASGGRIAIPTHNVKRSAAGKITKANRPRNLKNKWESETSGGPAIFQLKGGELKPMYWLEDSAKIEKGLEFRNTAQDLFKKRFKTIFNLELNKTIATAR